MRIRAQDAKTRAFMRDLHARSPRLPVAVYHDARVFAKHRGERSEFESRLDALIQVVRLMWSSDAFTALLLYRLRTSLRARRVPILPGLLHKLSMAIAQVSIGEPVLLHPGVYIVHGQVVIDGLVEVFPEVTLAPWVTLGLRAGDAQGPTIRNRVAVGTGAKVIGPVTIGAEAQIGANSVVVDDVAEGETVVGAPARPVRRGRERARSESSERDGDG